MLEMRLVRRSIRLAIGMATTALAIAGGPIDAEAQPARLEYRVVHAAPRELQRRVDEAGREGFSCVSVARPEQDVRLNGVVVILARPATVIRGPRVMHRIELGGGGGGDLQALLDRGGAEGFRLCGVVLAEVTPAPILVAVMSRRTDTDVSVWHYAAEVLGNRDRLARLVAKGREGFEPVATTPVNDNRLVEQRSWIVVAEKSATSTLPIDIAIRSGPGPDSLQRAIVEQSKQGYIVNLLWKEGLTTIVVAMSRLPVESTVRPEFVVDTIDPSWLDGLSGVYKGDVPYLSDGQRVVLTIRDRSSTNYVVQDRLPFMGTLEYADLDAMRPLGDHLSRNRGAREHVTFASVRRDDRGGLILHTVLTRFSQ
jgi:hypothetical protein